MIFYIVYVTAAGPWIPSGSPRSVMMTTREPDFPEATTVFCRIGTSNSSSSSSSRMAILDRPHSAGGFRGRVSSFSGTASDSFCDSKSGTAAAAAASTAAFYSSPQRQQQAIRMADSNEVGSSRRSTHRRADLPMGGGGTRGGAPLVGRSESCTPSGRHRIPPAPPVRSHRTSLSSLVGNLDDDDDNDVDDVIEYSTATIRPRLHRHSSLTPLTIDTNLNCQGLGVVGGGLRPPSSSTDFPPPPSPNTLQASGSGMLLDAATIQRPSPSVGASTSNSSSRIQPPSHPPVSSGYLRLHRRTASGPIYPPPPAPPDVHAASSLLDNGCDTKIAQADGSSSSSKVATKAKVSSSCQTERATATAAVSASSKPPISGSNGGQPQRAGSHRPSLTSQRSIDGAINSQQDQGQNTAALTYDCATIRPANRGGGGHDVNSTPDPGTPRRKLSTFDAEQNNNNNNNVAAVTAVAAAAAMREKQQEVTYSQPCNKNVDKHVVSAIIHTKHKPPAATATDSGFSQSAATACLPGQSPLSVTNNRGSPNKLVPSVQPKPGVQNDLLSAQRLREPAAAPVVTQPQHVPQQQQLPAQQVSPVKKQSPPVTAPKPVVKPKPALNSSCSPLKQLEGGVSGIPVSPSKKLPPPTPPKRNVDTHLTKTD